MPILDSSFNIIPWQRAEAEQRCTLPRRGKNLCYVQLMTEAEHFGRRGMLSDSTVLNCVSLPAAWLATEPRSTLN